MYPLFWLRLKLQVNLCCHKRSSWRNYAQYIRSLETLKWGYSDNSIFWALQINMMLWNRTAYYITVLEILGAVGLGSMSDTFHYIITVTKICSKRRNGSCCWCRNNREGRESAGWKESPKLLPSTGSRSVLTCASTYTVLDTQWDWEQGHWTNDGNAGPWGDCKTLPNPFGALQQCT